MSATQKKLKPFVRIFLHKSIVVLTHTENTMTRGKLKRRQFTESVVLFALKPAQLDNFNKNNLVPDVYLHASFSCSGLPICLELCSSLNVIKHFLHHLINASPFIKKAEQERSMLNTLNAKQASLKDGQLLPK